MTAYDPNSRADRRALADALVRALDAHGFTRVPGAGEWVYRRPTPTPRIEVRVYTTIDAGEVRVKASDAIRVILAYVDGEQERGLTRFPRVFRTGEIDGIVDRTLARMHGALDRVGALPTCGRCKAPMFLTKRNAYVCAALCWKSAPPPAVVTVAQEAAKPEATKPSAPKPFIDPFATRTLASLRAGTQEIAKPVTPTPCVDGWEIYGAKGDV